MVIRSTLVLSVLLWSMIKWLTDLKQLVAQVERLLWSKWGLNLWVQCFTNVAILPATKCNVRFCPSYFHSLSIVSYLAVRQGQDTTTKQRTLIASDQTGDRKKMLILNWTTRSKTDCENELYINKSCAVRWWYKNIRFIAVICVAWTSGQRCR
jgi:hypothetical protein